MRRRLLWQLYPAFLAVAIGSLLLVGVYAARSVQVTHRASLKAELESRAHMLARWVAEVDGADAVARIDTACRELGELTRTRLTVVLPDGRVMGDTLEDPARMDRHHTRPEIGAALAGRVGEHLRYSATLGEPLLYVAVPVFRNGDVVGAARASLPLAAIREQQAALRRRLLIGGLVAAALAAVSAFGLSKRIVRPVERMRRVAERYADGDFGARMAVEGPEEIARLGDVLNRMGKELRNRIDTVTEQRNERDAVLAAMTEGVFTVDADARFVEINAAAAHLLNTSPAEAKGKPLSEIARNSRLQTLVEHTVREGEPGECDLVLRVPNERFVQARAVALPPRGRAAAGAAGLVVMAEVTRLKRLEAVRRDFVSNVSHELKTPITSIRAACETLIDNAESTPGDTRRFLDIIHRQADRLESIVEDLLSLSRIEHGTERDEIRREVVPIGPVVGAALAACRKRAETRQVRLEREVEGDPKAALNPALIEQALINLVDNAVKFSPPDGVVRIECAGEGDRLRIRVIDQGPGIAPEHHERIFERFYCVDPGRSRTLGGTGLGLAIVKHIALAHGGEVRVESTPGHGSTFILDLYG